jgi:hypothetical protein
MFPQSPAATAALSVASRFYSPALLNHCVRSYLWGAMYGAAHCIAFDDELYYVSALLHDIGLTDAFDSHRLPSRRREGTWRGVFGVAAGRPADRAARATEIIVLPMRDDVSPTVDLESHILQVATSWEVIGRRPEEFPLRQGRKSSPAIPGTVSAQNSWRALKIRRNVSLAAPPLPRLTIMLLDESRPTRSMVRRVRQCCRGPDRSGRSPFQDGCLNKPRNPHPRHRVRVWLALRHERYLQVCRTVRRMVPITTPTFKTFSIYALGCPVAWKITRRPISTAWSANRS